jgi:PPOX class probable FMN-dependent enzyme
MGTMGADGTGDVSPKGGPPGFVRVLDDAHLAFGDRPGNNRLDSLRNLFERPGLGLLFLIPGYDVSILRVNGEGFITVEQSILDVCAVDGESPKTAIVVSVREAFVHCTKSLYRAGMWDSSRWPDTTGVASIGDMVRHHMELFRASEPPAS